MCACCVGKVHRRFRARRCSPHENRRATGARALRGCRMQAPADPSSGSPPAAGRALVLLAAPAPPAPRGPRTLRPSPIALPRLGGSRCWHRSAPAARRRRPGGARTATGRAGVSEQPRETTPDSFINQESGSMTPIPVSKYCSRKQRRGPLQPWWTEVRKRARGGGRKRRCAPYRRAESGRVLAGDQRVHADAF